MRGGRLGGGFVKRMGKGKVRFCGSCVGVPIVDLIFEMHVVVDDPTLSTYLPYICIGVFRL